MRQWRRQLGRARGSATEAQETHKGDVDYTHRPVAPKPFHNWKQKRIPLEHMLKHILRMDEWGI